VRLGNELRLPVVTFFGIEPFIERANGRHYRFLVEGLADIAPVSAGAVSASSCGDIRITGCCRLPRCAPGNRRRRREPAAPDGRLAREGQRRSARAALDGGRGRRRSRQAPAQGTLRGEDDPAAVLEHLDEFLTPSKDPAATIRWRAPAG
jgi:hypothetical protein